MKKMAVPAVALMLAIATVVTVMRLQADSDTGRDAEVRLGHVERAVGKLAELPWDALPDDTEPAVVRKQISAVELEITRTLEALPRHAAASQLDQARERYDTSRPLLRRQLESAARGDIPSAAQLAEEAEQHVEAMLRHLREAGDSFERDAASSLTRATIGSSAAILLLLGAFGFFYQRSIRARERLAAALTSLEAVQRERSRLLAQTVRSAEQERVRIAADLHDGPIQHLASLGYMLDRAHRRLRRGDADDGLEHLERARRDLTLDVDGLRRLMAELRPPVLDEGGLQVAIGDYLDAFAREHGVAVEYNARLDGVELSPEIETVLYRVAQESLSNVAKHADAGHVTVALSGHRDGAELRIDDDGRGFDPALLTDSTRNGRYGVIGMRERVENIGGAWELRSRRGRGTSVRISLPLMPSVPDAEQEEVLV